MSARRHRVADARITAAPWNWGLLLVTVLCLEFWLILAGYLTHNL
jgi:hypothetical protein